MISKSEIKKKIKKIKKTNKKPNWSCYSNKEKTVEITLEDGSKLKYGPDKYREFYKDHFCKECGEKIWGEDFWIYDLLEGSCKGCYVKDVTKSMRVPLTISPEYYPDHKYEWRDLLKEASDRINTRFGINDEVEAIDEVPKVKGKVIRIHKYSFKTFSYFDEPSYESISLVQVLLGDRPPSLLINVKANDLFALTNEYAKRECREIKELTDVICTFDPNKTKDSAGNPLEGIFEDDVARAIWMTYRRNHIVCKEHLDMLYHFSLSFSEKVKKGEINPNYMFHEFKKRFNFETGIRMDDCIISFLVPYLRGEKKATYIIQKEKAKTKR